MRARRIHVHSPPLGEGERTTMREYTGLCGRKFYGVGYMNTDHLASTAKSYGADGGPGWGNWCLDCKRLADSALLSTTKETDPK